MAFMKQNNLTKEQIKKWKITEREIFENYDNLSEHELSEKGNKNVYDKNDVMTTVIKRCRSENSRMKFQNVQNTKSNQKQETHS